MDPQLLEQQHRAGPALTPQRPQGTPPHRTASIQERAAWSERYVAWFIAQTPQDGPLPPDIPPTHRYEVEFAYCMLDPQRYERETLEELRRPTMH
jgi:hypothetical protein